MMTASLKLLPYGISSFEDLRRDNYYYVDKTRFIKKIEDIGLKYTFFVRPRRFGKTLFSTTLQAYYDKAASPKYESLFKDTFIYHHPSKNQGAYYVLRLVFSEISTDNVTVGFSNKLRDGFSGFFNRYPIEGAQKFLGKDFSDPANFFNAFCNLVQGTTGNNLFIIIDEYDQFANTVLANDPEEFRRITSRDGFLKNFYSAIKNRADEGLVQRVFITGVTSISLDSMTSGFSIARDITQNPHFADLAGFTNGELSELIAYFTDNKIINTSPTEIQLRMKDYYNGYLFSPFSTTSVFNSSMCLYYLSELSQTGHEPLTLLDKAVGTDLAKISNILKLGDTAFVRSCVRQLAEEKTIDFGGFSDSINLNQKNLFSNDDVLSVLFYLGYLTYSSSDPSQLVCPNKAVKSQFLSYLLKFIDDIDFNPSVFQVRKAMSSLRRGDIMPLLSLISEKLTTGTSLHALTHFNESNIQTALKMTVSLTTDYTVDMETEVAGIGYIDLFIHPVEGTGVPYLLELKYIKKADLSEKTVKKACDAATKQLLIYSTSGKFAKIHNLRKLGIVFVGTSFHSLVEC